mgnify:CR=1 FL=1
MQLQNEIVKKHTPIKSLLIDWLIIFGTYLFIRIFFALFGLHQNIVLLGCCLAILPYLFGALYLQKSHKQCQLWLAALAILIPSVVEKAAIYLFGAYLYNLRPINVVGVMEAIKSNAPYTNFIKNQSAQNLINLSYFNWTYILCSISVKTRSALEVKRRSGDFVGAFTIYGYVKVGDKHKSLEVDEYAANVVRDIFRKRLEGFSASHIADELNRLGILSPLAYKRNHGMPHAKGGYTDRKDCKWSATTIIRILQDETYTGTLVQGKQTTPHFKLKEREDKPSSEWIRVEGTHEAIIQKHDFDLVQRLRRIDTRTSPKSDKVYLFSGILICGCCGCRMTRKTNRYKDKEYHYYYCPTGKKNGCTSSVMLKESDLIECVQDSLKGHIENVASLDALLSSISQERINRELAQEYAAQIRVNEKRVAQTEGFKAKLYENLVSGILTKEEFLSYKRKYNADIELFQKAIVEWNDKLTDVLENRSERNRWINHFMKFSTMEDIDRRAVMQLIRSIRVMGKDELHIEFNYQDEYQKAISLAEQIATKNEERMVG